MCSECMSLCVHVHMCSASVWRRAHQLTDTLADDVVLLDDAFVCLDSFSVL